MSHKRKTPPVKVQVIDPYFTSNAFLKKRLIDFDTGSAELEEQHKAWLRHCMNVVKVNSSFHVRLFGYASRLGSAERNRRLSLNRMNSVYTFMQNIDRRGL